MKFPSFNRKPRTPAATAAPNLAGQIAPAAPIATRDQPPNGTFPVKGAITGLALAGIAVFTLVYFTSKHTPTTKTDRAIKDPQDVAASTAPGGPAAPARDYRAMVNDLHDPRGDAGPSAQGASQQPYQTGPGSLGSAPIPGVRTTTPGPPTTVSLRSDPNSKDSPQDPLNDARIHWQIADEQLEHESLSSPLRVGATRNSPSAIAPAPTAHQPATAAPAAVAPTERPPLGPPTTATAPAQPTPPSAPNQSGERTQATRQQQSAQATARALQEYQNSANGPIQKLYEGTIIETVLTNRLNSSFTGPVDCLVTTAIWSHNREHVLIPQGSRLLGEAKRVSQIGQNRLAVIFHRVVMPDGYSVSLDNFTGLNQIGETGLKDKVDNHYVQIFGASMALGAIAGLATATSSSGIAPTGADTLRQGFSQELSREATQILDRFLNILPTVTIREGTRVKVYLSGDLLLPAYDNHRMPNDL